MDDANHDASNARRVKPKSILPGWCALAGPIIQSISYQLARRYWLQPCDRQDFEQELWLELLVRHGGRDRAEEYRLLRGQDVRRHRNAVWLQLRAEVERIAVALAQSWAFWRRLRPAPERPLTRAVSATLTAADAYGSPRRCNLSLDVVTILAELSTADRTLCEALMAGAGDLPSDDSQHERRIAALQADFSAADLHEYL